MNNKNKVLLGIVLILLIILLYQNRALNNELEGLKDHNAVQEETINNKKNEVNELTQKLEEAIDAKKTLKEEIELLTDKLEASKIPNEVTKFKLEQQGINDYKIIERDLLSKPELITIDGVLGGTMYFTEAYLLNEKWIYATFEDGHIMGSALYAYEILSPEEIKWEVIEAITD